MKDKCKIEIPGGAAAVMARLNESGYRAYIVGGCVRDSLRGIVPHDWDIATNATPDDMRRVFRSAKLVPTGTQYGTMTVISRGEQYEVTTFRADGEYSDGRRPDCVSYADSIEEDLSRRDFTVNAMAYSDESGLIDLFGGYSDLQNGVIRCVGVPQERFNEDALRIMRAVRFAVTLDFELPAETNNAIWDCGHNLVNVSQERKTAELVKTLRGLHAMNRDSRHYQRVCRMTEYIIKRTIPEFIEMAQVTHNSRYHYTDIFTHTTDMLFAADTADTEILLCILFHDTGKIKARTFDERRLTNHYYGHEKHSAAITREVLRRMRFDSRTVDRVSRLVEVHDFRLSPNPKTVKRLLNKLGLELCLKLVEFQRYDKKAHRWFHVDDYRSWQKIADDTETAFREIHESGEPYTLGALAVNGGDIMEELGIKPGRLVGEILEYCLNAVIDCPERNTREELLRLARARGFAQGLHP